MKQVLTSLSILLLIFSCSTTIDGSSMINYKTSLDKMKESLSEQEKDSLSKSITAIISESGYSLFQMDSIILAFDGLTAEQIFAKGGKIIEKKKLKKLEEQRISDSIRTVFIKDSIAKYEAQGIWEIKHFVDEFKNETKEGYVLNTSEGIFTNSATDNSRLKGQLLVTDKNKTQIFLYEYGNQPVKAYGSDYINYVVKVLQDGEEKRFEGILINDRIHLDDEFLEVVKKGGKAKVYLKDSPRYGNPSTYLIEFDFTNFEKAVAILKG